MLYKLMPDPILKKIIVVTIFILLFLNSGISGKTIKIIKAVSSSVEKDNSEFKAENVIDLDRMTRWASDWSEQQWIYFDLGKVKKFNEIDIFWENAYAKQYEIQISDNKEDWKMIFKENNGNGNEDIILTGDQKARYIRIYGVKRSSQWGYSIYDVEIVKTDTKMSSSISDKLSENIKPIRVISSSIENNNQERKPENTIDKNIRTRWASDWSDKQWISFDLGIRKKFNTLTVLWEDAHAKAYEIQISDDYSEWKTIYEENDSKGDKEIIHLGSQTARIIRVYCTKRATTYGYSIHELNVIRSDSKPPSSPTGCSILKGDSILALDWKNNTEPDIYGYSIYRSGTKNGKYKKISNDIIRESRYVDKKVKNGNKYYYVIRAVDYLENESKNSKKYKGTAEAIKRKGTYLDVNLPVEKRVKDLLFRMTMDEKIEQLHGIPNFDDMTTCSNERLGIPSIKCADGPYGVRWKEPATAFPVSIALASTWDPELIKNVYTAIAKELIAKGRNHSLGPCLNLCKDPRGGRTFEGYGEDIYLTAKMAAAAVKGIQSRKIIATPKHFACNNIEFGRGGGPVMIDERTLREIYLPAFEVCIKEADAWSVMGAYNKINGSYCCANKHLLRDILKDEWGFKGFVITDWFACHSTVKSANSGLDLEMPTPVYYGKSLIDAVEEGLVSKETINDMAGRMLRIKFMAGLFDEEPKMDKSIIECKAHTQLALDAARKSIVLLKNRNNILPLDTNKIKTIAVLGPNADKTTVGEGLGSSQLNSSYIVTPLKGIKNKAGNKIKIINDPSEADAVIICVGLTESIAGRVEGEGIDRTYLYLPGKQEQLIKRISSVNKNVIVVLLGGTAITMNKWIENVSAVIEAWYCGQEGGNAIADVLFGKYNPGGRLPITFPVSLKQLPPLNWNYKGEYKTGIGYCYYEKKGLKPLFPFGYGLSYTKFKYSNLKITPKSSKNGVIKISVDIKNVGRRKGDEVVQLYLQDEKRSIEGPIKQLKRFKRITLKPGKKIRLNFKLMPKDMMFYNKNMKRVVEPGSFKVMIGSSSRDIKLSGRFKIKRLISGIK